VVICSFLGNACLEIEGSSDHVIIDPVFLKAPKKGIERVLITHHHDDHFDLNKLNVIKENYSSKDRDLIIYIPNYMKEKINMPFVLIKPEDLIELNSGKIIVLNNDCWKAENCVAFLVEIDGKKILHTADSNTFSKELGEIQNGIDCCFIACFEDHFKSYLEFIENIKPKLVVPYHFTENKEESAKKLVDFLKNNGIESVFIPIGEKLNLS